jgi:hypothetical protein
MAGLTLGQALVTKVETETRERYGIPMPQVETPEGASWRPESDPMLQRPGETYHRCFVEGFDQYPRRHGTYATLASDTLVQAILDSSLSPDSGSRNRGLGLVGMSVLFTALGLLGGYVGGRARARRRSD